MISGILLTKPNAPDMLTGRELNDLKGICALLHPLENLTTKMSGEKYAVISTVIPLLNCVKSATESIIVESDICIDLQKNILSEIHRRFKDIEKFNDFPLATLLDPRLVNLDSSLLNNLICI